MRGEDRLHAPARPARWSRGACRLCGCALGALCSSDAPASHRLVCGASNGLPAMGSPSSQLLGRRWAPVLSEPTFCLYDTHSRGRRLRDSRLALAELGRGLVFMATPSGVTEVLTSSRIAMASALGLKPPPSASNRRSEERVSLSKKIPLRWGGPLRDCRLPLPITDIRQPRGCWQGWGHGQGDSQE